MKIGIYQTAAKVFGGFEQQMQAIAAAGFEAVDYQEFIDGDGPILSMRGHEFEKTLREQGNIARACGVTVSQTHGPWRYPPRDGTKEERAERIPKILRAIEGTALLGCDSFVIHPLMPFSTHDQGHERETYDMNLEFLAVLSETGGKYGVDICLENMPMTQFSLADMRDIARIVKEIAHPRLKICLDTGHCAIVGDGQRSAAAAAGGLLKATHVHDNNSRHDQHLAPFEGVVDWSDLAAGLREIRFDGALSLETGRTRLPPDLQSEYLSHLRHRAACIKKLIYFSKKG